VAPLAHVLSPELAAGLVDAREYVEGIERVAKDTPGPGSPRPVAPPNAQVLDPERKRIHDAIRMATYNAESMLARLLRGHFARADDQARTLA
jgi:hypothetical protein